MAEIRILDAKTINQIAAGEVVERPASVVKELVENAIDAHADAISVEIKEGGVAMIRITDNGDGIAPDQVRSAFARHATSKIRTAEDLRAIASLGFRGEALSSIAAVARVELFTKTKDEIFGVHYEIEGGAEKTYEEVGVPDGTTFVIRSLFFNTPARRKFLKSGAAEAARIQDLVTQLAFSHPEISFKFTAGGKTRLHTGGHRRLQELVYEIYGREIAGQLLEIHDGDDTLRIDGCLGSPVVGRGNRNFEHYYINGRYIRSKIVSAAIEDAYAGFLMQHKYPFVVLSIEMPPSLLDCNVHPSKMEVRFSDSSAVYETIKHAVAARLGAQEMIVHAPVDAFVRAQGNAARAEADAAAAKTKAPTKTDADEKTDAACANAQLSADGEEKTPLVREPDVPYGVRKEPYVPEPFETKQRAVYAEKTKEELSAFSEETAKNEQLELFDDRFLSKKAAKRHRIVGQVFATYWIIEYDEKMFLIDQHAAHEKVNYERMVRRLREKQTVSQQVSPPILLSLGAAEEEKLHVYADYFARLGYEIEPFGDRDYAIRAVPVDLYGHLEKELFYRILDELDPEIGRTGETAILEKLASMSCKAAVKGGMKLSYAEMDKLLEELLTLEDPYHCPHGRPVIVSFSKRDLEKMFKRIV